MNHVTPLLGRVPRTLRGSVMLLPLACVVIAGCSGSSSSAPPKTQPPAASPTQSTDAGPAPTQAAAKASPSAPACYDTCGKTEPVIFFINSTISADNYDGVRPSTIDLSVDTPNSNVVSGLSWSSWASGTNGQVPAGATAKGTGKLTSNGSATVTITLSDPINGDPTLWGTLTEQIPGKQPAVYHYNGMWATSASGGQQP